MNKKLHLLLADWRHFTAKCPTLRKKIHRLNEYPGMKIVLLNRTIKYLQRAKILKPILLILKYKYNRYKYKYGIQLPLKCNFGENLRIYHFGNIFINPNCIIGNNVSIMHGVTIGNTMFKSKCPTIGDGVFIGAGAKIIGEIEIANNVKIGANSLVTESILTPNVVAVGVPAKIIRTRTK